MGAFPGQPGGMPGQPPMGGMGGPPMGGMPGQPPMGGMPGQPPMGMPGQPMGGIGGFPGAPGGVPFTGGAGIGKMASGFNKLRMIATIVGVVILVIGGSAIGIYSYTHPTLHMVNNTGKDGVSIFIDGAAVATSLKNAPTESWLASTSSGVSSGTHKVEAKDAGGKVIESFSMDFKSGSNGYLYSPMHSKDVCFVIQVDVYGKTFGSGPKDTLLDRARNFWEMPSSIDRWFQDTPDSVKLGKGQSSATKRAVRQIPCSAL